MAQYAKTKVDNVISVSGIVTALYADLRNRVSRTESHDFPEIFYMSVLLMMASLIAGVLYLLFFGGFYKCYKRLGGRDVELLAEGIVEARPTLRKNKNVYFGKNAMYLKRTCALLPYSDIGWIYVHRQTAVAIIPIITETVIIRTKFGDQLEISIKREDLLAVLQHLVLPSNPQILVGFNEENKKTYNELVKDVKKLSSNYDYQK